MDVFGVLPQTAHNKYFQPKKWSVERKKWIEMKTKNDDADRIGHSPRLPSTRNTVKIDFAILKQRCHRFSKFRRLSFGWGEVEFIVDYRLCVIWQLCLLLPFLHVFFLLSFSIISLLWRVWSIQNIVISFRFILSQLFFYIFLHGNKNANILPLTLSNVLLKIPLNERWFCLGFYHNWQRLVKRFIFVYIYFYSFQWDSNYSEIELSWINVMPLVTKV